MPGRADEHRISSASSSSGFSSPRPVRSGGLGVAATATFLLLSTDGDHREDCRVKRRHGRVVIWTREGEKAVGEGMDEDIRRVKR
jgi:hypothetical protein